MVIHDKHNSAKRQFRAACAIILVVSTAKASPAVVRCRAVFKDIGNARELTKITLSTCVGGGSSCLLAVVHLAGIGPPFAARELSAERLSIL